MTMAGKSRFSLACVFILLQSCSFTGQAATDNNEASPPSSSSSSSSSKNDNNNDNDGPKLVCYYTPTSYFPPSKVPSHACTHLIYAFGSLQGSGSSAPSITPPSPGQASAWVTLTSLRRHNPRLKVLLSLQRGFPDVVGSDTGKMQQFAVNSVTYLRKYQFDGVDMDWEFPSSSQRTFFANFLTIMRTAIDKEARAAGRPALLLSLALPNSYPAAQKGYDIPSIASAVDFGTAMTYDFHLYSKVDNTTGYNSPLFTPPGEYKYFSASAMAEYYLTRGMAAGKLLLGVPTYGRSWRLAQPSDHGLHAPAVAKGDPGPYRHLRGVYAYPDACTALKQGSTNVSSAALGAVYLYHDTAWVAYDDTNTVTAKCRWAVETGLGGVGVWAITLDDVDGVCGVGSLPLITAMGRALRRPQLPQHSRSDLINLKPSAKNVVFMERRPDRVKIVSVPQKPGVARINSVRPRTNDDPEPESVLQPALQSHRGSNDARSAPWNWNMITQSWERFDGTSVGVKTIPAKSARGKRLQP